jgi:hypothetical protein
MNTETVGAIFKRRLIVKLFDKAKMKYIDKVNKLT